LNQFLDIDAWGKSEEHILLVFTERVTAFLNMKTRQFRVCSFDMLNNGSGQFWTPFGKV